MPIQSKSNYERECELFALYGNQERDDQDYEFNAQFDHKKEMFSALDGDFEMLCDEEMYRQFEEEKAAQGTPEGLSGTRQQTALVTYELPEGDDCPF